MVHIGDKPLARSFAAQIDSLCESAAEDCHPVTPEAGFADWAIAQSDSSIVLDIPPLDVGTLPAHRWTEAPVLAAIGYRLDTGLSLEAAIGGWLEGMQRLMLRDPVPVDRRSFFFSPLELLGLASGSRAVADVDPSPLNWLRGVINSHADRLPVESQWSRCVVSIAAHRIGAEAPATDPVIPRVALDLALLLWLELSDFGDAVAMLPSASDYRGDLLRMAATSEPRLLNTAEKAILAIALHDAVLTTLGGIELHPTSATQFIVGLCRQFPTFIRELGSRYNQREPFDVNDEYDLQDLLRAVLSIHFSDIRKEEWNPSYGGSQSRSDFLLKPERVVIETKMTRRDLGQRQVLAQLTIDKAQYSNHPDCKTLVCFVYDPDHRLHNATAIENDLSDDVGGLRTHVVVSPKGL